MSSSSLLRTLGVAGSAGTLATGSVAALLAALAAAAAPAAAASTFVVDDASDGAANAADCTTPVPGSCSLRDAAAAAVDGDTVVFAFGVSSITLTTGSISLAAVNIAGPGSGALTITTTAAAGAYDLFSVGGTGDVTVSGLKLTKNQIATDNTGKFTLDDVVVEDSTASNFIGGALRAANPGDLVIRNSHFNRNTAAAYGGAVMANNMGDVIVSDSTFDSNNAGIGGGAITLTGDTVDLTLERSTLSGNSTTGLSGGIYVGAKGDVTITDSVFEGNESVGAGGAAGLANGGDTTITRTSVTDNATAGKGGGLYVVSPSGSSLTIVSSLFADNSAAKSGGAIFIEEGISATIANSTLTGNSSGEVGGALYLGSVDLQLLQTTIAENAAIGGGGLFASGVATVFMSGSIISGNTGTPAGALGVPDDISARNDSSSFNSTHSLIGTVDSNVTLTDDAGTIRNNEPGLEALADNGGPTKTMALSATSPALDAGPATVATFPDNQYDQRGIGYARVVNGTVDVGAFEIQAPEPVVPSFTG